MTNEPSKRSRKNLTAYKSSPRFPTTPELKNKSENEEFNEITDTDDTASSSELFDHSRRRINVPESNEKEKIIKKKKIAKTKVNLPADPPSPKVPAAPEREDKPISEEFNELADTDNTTSSSGLLDRSGCRINVPENNKKEKIIKKKRIAKTKVNLPVDLPSPKVPATPKREDESETEECPETIEDPKDRSSLEISDHSYCRHTVPENNEEVKVTKKKKLEINKENLPAKISIPNITRTTGTEDESYSEEGIQTWTSKPGEGELKHQISKDLKYHFKQIQDVRKKEPVQSD